MSSSIELVASFRKHLDAYRQVVDGWEAVYGSRYRLSMPNRVSKDLQPSFHKFVECRQYLGLALPHVQSLRHRFGICENWSALLKTSLESRTPQGGGASIIGRSKRNLAITALTKLHLAVLGGDLSSAEKTVASEKRLGIVNILQGLFQ